MVCDIDEGSDWVSVGKQRDNSTVVETTRRFFMSQQHKRNEGTVREPWVL